MATPTNGLDTQTIPFELKLNLITVDVAVNGVMKSFVLDTGASATVVSQRTADELKLPRAQMEMQAVSCRGDVASTPVQVERLSVGGMEMHDLCCPAVDMDSLIQPLKGEISGVLGYDFLSKFRTTIDYRARELTFEPHEA